MKSEWVYTTLGNIVTLQRGIDLPAQKRKSGNIPVVASTGVAGFHNKAAVKGPGVVIGRSGSIGGGQFIREDFWPLNTTLWVKDFHGNNPRFCYYLLKSMNFSSLNAGSGVPTLNRNHLHTIPILCPSIKIQRLIADYLGSIDDKIELNRKINQTLEALAQAIFKSWFVDFEPTKAKIAALKQNQDPLRATMCAISGKADSELNQLPREDVDQLAATAALFPDAMVQSELGQVPKNWMLTAVRDVAEVTKGKSYSSKDLVDNNHTALVTLKSFERGGGFRMNGFKSYTGTYKTQQTVSPGELIIAYTDVTQAADLIGKPAIVIGIEKYKTLVASLDIGIIRPLDNKIERQFLYGLFMTENFQAHTLAHTSGTTVLHLAKEAVPSYLFACPNARLVKVYSGIAEGIAMLKQKQLNEISSLSSLRDTLLPKLLSGELIIPNDITDEKIL